MGFRIGKTGKPQLGVGAKAIGVTINGCRLQGGEKFDIGEEVTALNVP